MSVFTMTVLVDTVRSLNWSTALQSAFTRGSHEHSSGRGSPRLFSTVVAARVLDGVSVTFVWMAGLTLCLETVVPVNLGKTIGPASISSKVAKACSGRY